mgnify:FL=1|jgi:extradiol dioxygenase family protein
MQAVNPFHLAIPVKNLEVCRKFYNEVLGCTEGRNHSVWIDFDFFGHQLVLHQNGYLADANKGLHNPVDCHNVPIPHFGIVLAWSDWENLAVELKNKGIEFIIEPHIRFKGEVGEQGTMFFYDPEGNALEFKAFKDIKKLFAK